MDRVESKTPRALSVSWAETVAHGSTSFQDSQRDVHLFRLGYHY